MWLSRSATARSVPWWMPTASTLDTRRDRTVCSTTYLDAGKYPDLDFVAAEVQTDDERWLVDGTPSAPGVAVPLQIIVHAVDELAGEVRIHASAQVDSYAHGITTGRGIAGRQLAIEIAAVATPDRSPRRRASRLTSARPSGATWSRDPAEGEKYWRGLLRSSDVEEPKTSVEGRSRCSISPARPRW
jgi:hypothetical protein